MTDAWGFSCLTVWAQLYTRIWHQSGEMHANATSGRTHLGDGRVDWQAEMGLAGLLWRDTSDKVGSAVSRIRLASGRCSVASSRVRVLCHQHPEDSP